jgi:hypothetical protein
MYAWDKSEAPGKINFSRIVSIATLAIAVLALILAIRKPVPVATPQPPAAVAANAQSFQEKFGKLEQAQSQGQTGAEVRLTADEIGAAIAQATGQVATAPPSTSAAPGISSDPNTAISPGAVDQASFSEPLISFEGNVVHGQFLTELAGKKVYITVSGHLGAKDGYATFEPTDFKVGDLNVPVSLVNDALQRKMLEQRDRLKLPDYVSDVRIENGDLVIKHK